MRIVALLYCLLSVGNKALAADSVAYTVRTYVYKKVGTNELKLDVFVPTATKQSRPVIILFHGGSWVSGDRSQLQGQCRYFVQQGLVAVTADYRLLNQPAGHKDTCITDARSVVRWIKNEARQLHIDTNQIFLGGASAGGHLATMAILNQTLNDLQDNPTITVTAKALILFNPAYQLTESPALEPFQYVNTHFPPTLFFFGSKDKWKAAADSLRTQLKKAGVYTETWIAEDQTHGFFNKAPWDLATCLKAQEFLAKYGIGKPAGPTPAPAMLVRED